MKKIILIALSVGIAVSSVRFAWAQTENYPVKPVRLIVPFPEGGAPGLVSRRPACGEGVQADGFYTIAAVTTLSYPEKPIRLIVPFPAGGSVDLIARLVAPKLAESLGQQFVIDNRSGASGNIGTEMAARAAPDGYTLLVHTIPFVANTYLNSRVPYDVLNDFAPVSLLSSSPSLLAVHPSLPARSVRELLALAKSRPGALNYASAGIGTNPHIAGELFNYLGKVNIVAVQFKGGAPALIATMSGEVGVTFTNLAETSAYVKANRLRALGISSTKRSALMPDVPTIAEAGLPGYEFVAWHGMLGPKGTPRVIVALLNERLKRTMGSPQQSQLFKDRGLDIVASSPEEFAAHLKSELEKWGRVIKERGMRAD